MLHQVLKPLRVHSHVDHFRQQSLIVLVALMALSTWIWIIQILENGQTNELIVLLLALATLLTVWLIYRFYRVYFLGTTVLFLGAQVLMICVALWLTQDLAIAHLFLLTIVMGGALAGPTGAFTSAGVIIAAELPLLGFSSLSATTLELIGVLWPQGLATLVSWQASMGLYNALESAERNAQEARQHAEDARHHRAELQRTLKSLDLAYYQLERAHSELYHAREFATAALRFKREFAAQISHELRTSLNLVLGFSETIAFSQHSYGEKLPAVYLRDVTEIHRNSRHLLALIDDVLDLSKLETGRMGLYREPVDVCAVVREAADIIQPLVDMKELDLSLELVPALPTLHLDRLRIRQIVLNLLSNAVRATKVGGVTISVCVDASELVVSVTDTGPGIPPEQLEQVFEEFHQVGANGGSAGLGLTVSKQIVSLHGGHMRVESQVGIGSKFAFAFPLEESLAPSSVRSPSSTLPGRSSKPTIIVLGETGTDEVKLLARHLGPYALVPAATWNDVLDLVRQTSARAVIANTFTESLSAPPELHVPLIACPLPGPQQTAQALGIEHYIQKPVSSKAIQRALHDAAPRAETLLIVDDDPSAVRLLERMVRSGARMDRIFRAYSGQEAWARVQAQRPDAILLDLAMPDGDGFWLLATLRAEAQMASIPVIVVSGRAVEETWQGQTIRLTRNDGFTPTEMLNYLEALVSTVPPAPTESDTTVPPLSASRAE